MQMQVGIRELKNRLSHYIHRVRSGEIIVVTDRGKPVARIIPIGVPEHIAELVAQRKMTWSRRPFRRPARRIRPWPGPPIAKYISEDRT
jgi:prevent-host-death family protein